MKLVLEIVTNEDCSEGSLAEVTMTCPAFPRRGRGQPPKGWYVIFEMYNSITFGKGDVTQTSNKEFIPSCGGENRRMLRVVYFGWVEESLT
ncbi:MAG TPA: hypothetical protein VFP87_10700, partial [Chitinophagaceae bacterium]|nr:hypothetical protein [Chitinophagaceae bacterium]